MMSEIHSAASIAKLLSDPLRLSILQFLTWGPCAVVSLVETTGASQPNVSNHLKLLREGGLVVADKKGRQTFYRIASPDIAEVISALSWAASETDNPPIRSMPHELREARTCYDHLGGRLGVKLMDGLINASAITRPSSPWDAIELGTESNEVFARMGIDLARAVGDGARRRFAFACPDWSEHQYSHLGGLLGTVICVHCQKQGWIERKTDSRAMVMTAEGEKALDWILHYPPDRAHSS